MQDLAPSSVTCFAEQGWLLGRLQMGSIGKRVRRLEDARFLTGQACYVDDMAPVGLVHGAVLRAPMGHARLRGLDVAAALAIPGVLLVLTAQDLAAVGIRDLPMDMPIPGGRAADAHPALQPVLAQEETRFVGEALAFLVALTPAIAQDGLEALAPDCEALPTIVAPPSDVTGGARAWAGTASNIALRHEEGDAPLVAHAFARAKHHIALDLHCHRVDALAMETRGCIGAFDADAGFTLHVSTQRTHVIQRALADHVFRVPRSQMRVVAPDTGGGFGPKNGLYPEYVLCLEAARRLGRAVKWIAARSEQIASTNHGRDNGFTIEAALDESGRILAIRAERRMNLGAYTAPRSMIPVRNGLTHLTGPYHVPAAHAVVLGVLTNTGCTSPYRGAGRPENVFCCERLIDLAARRIGMDPIAFRRANLVRPEAMPWTSPLGTRFAGIDPEALLDKALIGADHASLAERRALSTKAGRLRGFGISLFVEDLHGSLEPMPAHLRAVQGQLVLLMGSGGAGHGHETAFRQIAADRLGLKLARIGFVQSDTAQIPNGIGTAASWSMTLGGSSVHLVALAAIEAARAIAARHLEVAEAAVNFADGIFSAAPANRTLDWDDILAAAPDFAVSAAFEGHGETMPLSCHACEVEITPDTGAIILTRYVVAQDSGVLVNPMLVEGQLHGGVAQGVGQGWMEAIRYDAEGQLLSGSLMDYAVPRAADLPDIATVLMETPADDNPLGVKGVGEAAATGSTAAFVNAVLDALAPFGVTEIATPVTAERVWQAIRSGTAKLSGGADA